MWPTDREPAFGSFVAEQTRAVESLGVSVRIEHFDGRRSRFRYAQEALRVRTIVRDGIDLVHAHYGLSGAVACAQSAAPVVTTFWGSDTGYIRWQTRISRAVARRTTPIFVDAQAAIRFGVESPYVIPGGVDTERFRPMERREARDRLGWHQQGQFVLFPGARQNRVKGGDLFASAVEELRLKRPDVEPVYLEGFTRSEVSLVMNAVDATLMTSVAEGSPVAVKESLACMTPVVSVAVGDVPKVVSGLPGCSICERDPVRLADAVSAAIDGQRSALLRERAETFSLARTAERVTGVYRQVLAAS